MRASAVELPVRQPPLHHGVHLLDDLLQHEHLGGRAHHLRQDGVHALSRRGAVNAEAVHVQGNDTDRIAVRGNVAFARLVYAFGLAQDELTCGADEEALELSDAAFALATEYGWHYEDDEPYMDWALNATQGEILAHALVRIAAKGAS